MFENQYLYLIIEYLFLSSKLIIIVEYIYCKFCGLVQKTLINNLLCKIISPKQKKEPHLEVSITYYID